MGINLSAVDLSNVEARVALDVMPSGWQNAVIVDTGMKPTKDNAGQYMEVISEVIEGPFKGRKLFDRLNILNNNQTAVEIAYKTLKAIYSAVGKVRVNDSAELHGIPFKIKVKLIPAEIDPATGQEKYGAKNEVGGYDHISSDHNTGQGSSLAGGVAGAPNGAPAWANGTAAGPAAGQQPTNAGQAIGGPAAPGAPGWQAPAGAQPWAGGAAGAGGAPPPPNGAGAAPAPVQPVLQLTAGAQQGGLTLEDYKKQGWTDDALVQHGHAQWVQPAGPAFGTAAVGGPPAAPGAPASATGAAGGASPPWAR